MLYAAPSRVASLLKALALAAMSRICFCFTPAAPVLIHPSEDDSGALSPCSDAVEEGIPPVGHCENEATNAGEAERAIKAAEREARRTPTSSPSAAAAAASAPAEEGGQGDGTFTPRSAVASAVAEAVVTSLVADGEDDDDDVPKALKEEEAVAADIARQVQLAETAPTVSARYRALHKGIVRAGIDKNSAKVGNLDVGQILQVTKIVEVPEWDQNDTDESCTRLQFDQGWTSLYSSSGKTLLRVRFHIIRNASI